MDFPITLYRTRKFQRHPDDSNRGIIHLDFRRFEQMTKRDQED